MFKMESLAEASPKYRINPQNAREFAAKSHIARKQAHAQFLEQQRVDKLQEEQRLKEAAKLPQIPKDLQDELDIVQEQITHAREALNDKTPWCPACERPELQPQHRAQLMKGLDLFLDRKRIILGRPLPGSKRPAPERATKRRESQPAPLPETPQEESNDPNEPNG